MSSTCVCDYNFSMPPVARMPSAHNVRTNFHIVNWFVSHYSSSTVEQQTHFSSCTAELCNLNHSAYRDVIRKTFPKNLCRNKLSSEYPSQNTTSIILMYSFFVEKAFLKSFFLSSYIG